MVQSLIRSVASMSRLAVALSAALVCACADPGSLTFFATNDNVTNCCAVSVTFCNLLTMALDVFDGKFSCIIISFMTIETYIKNIQSRFHFLS